MEEKSKGRKVLKIILVIILILLAIYILLTVRKIAIMVGLDNKIAEYEEKDNIYVKTISDNSAISSYEKYYKNGVKKEVITSDMHNAKIMQYTYPKERKVFRESENNKTVGIYKEDSTQEYSPMLMNYVETYSMPYTIMNAMCSTITTKKLDDTEYYVIKTKYNANYTYDIDAKYIEIFIEKETGLTRQVIEYIKSNGEESKRTVRYQYSFGKVTDADIKEPDVKEYKMLKN